MANAEHKAVLSVDKDKLFAAITRYEDYPKFVKGVESVKVERKAAGKARATYKLKISLGLMSKGFTYTVDLTENPDTGVISWTLVDSDFFKKNDGSWTIKSAGAGKTDVLYQLEVDFKVSIPDMILNKLVKGSLPDMVKGFEKQAKSK